MKYNSEVDGTNFNFQLPPTQKEATEQPKKPLTPLCKGLIIGGIVLLVIIGVVILLVVLLGGGKDKEKKRIIVDETDEINKSDEIGHLKSDETIESEILKTDKNEPINSDIISNETIRINETNSNTVFDVKYNKNELKIFLVEKNITTKITEEKKRKRTK